MKLALYGGTFDPPHKAHSMIIKAVSEQLKYDKLLILPTGMPPHKTGVTKTEDRMAMARLAFGKYGEISDYDAVKQGRCYTAETVKYFYEQSGEKPFFIIGGDSLKDFPTWYKPEIILDYCNLVYLDRKKIDNQLAAEIISNKFNTNVYKINSELPDISSLNLRTSMYFKQYIGDKIDEDVHNYIRNHKLYCEYDAIIEKLKSYLKPSRMEHTFFTVRKGLELNKHFKLNDDKVIIACLLHDCAKYISADKYKHYGFNPDYNMSEPVIHAFLGSKVAEMDFCITDIEILNAIKYHTTGNDNMTALEKLVFLADFIEDSRGDYATETRNIAVKFGFDAAFKDCLKKLYFRLKENNSPLNIDPHTIKAVNYYEINKENI